MNLFDNKKNRQIFVMIFLFYNTVMTFILSFQLVTLTTLGDYRQYRDKIIFNLSDVVLFTGGIPVLLTEKYTVLLYSYAKLAVLPSWLLGYLLLCFIILRYMRHQKINLLNIFINFSIFNPITLQYFYFESKEFLTLLLVIIFLEIKNKKRFLPAFLFVLIRKENLLILFSLGRNYTKSLTLFVLLLLASTALILDSLDLSRLIFIIIENSFVADANTHRYWVNGPVHIYSQETFVFVLIGIYTSIFSFFPFEQYFLIFLPIGLFKLALLVKFLKNNQVSYSIFVLTMMILYCVPLSVYNVGSSTRYTMVAWVVLWVIHIKRKNSPIMPIKVKFGKKKLISI